MAQLDWSGIRAGGAPGLWLRLFIAHGCRGVEMALYVAHTGEGFLALSNQAELLEVAREVENHLNWLAWVGVLVV